MSLQIQKHKDRFASRQYRIWICSQKCFFCNSHECEPHHVKHRKWADGSDTLLIPACTLHHRMIEDHKIEFDLEKNMGSILLLWERFLNENGIPFIVPLTQEVFENLLRERGLVEPPFTKRKNRK